MAALFQTVDTGTYDSYILAAVVIVLITYKIIGARRKLDGGKGF